MMALPPDIVLSLLGAAPLVDFRYSVTMWDSLHESELPPHHVPACPLLRMLIVGSECRGLYDFFACPQYAPLSRSLIHLGITGTKEVDEEVEKLIRNAARMLVTLHIRTEHRMCH
jgi:hypothetical protein